MPITGMFGGSALDFYEVNPPTEDYEESRASIGHHVPMIGAML